ncbi:hypothetical protein [Aquimarina pacifica]|uniref:hypothetical protein n=1 Tax=Aquimarina pacifica TaxID=1296415 RepID=UPI00046ED45F|nr:hypothetical protein [Aquimarina pacifica]
MNILKKTLTICIAICSIYSCSEPVIDEQEPVKNQTSKFVYSEDRLVRYNGEFLEFESPEVLEQIKDFIQNAEYSEIQAWLDQFGFDPMHITYDKLISAEAEFLDELSKEGDKLNIKSAEALSNYITLNRPDVIEEYAHMINFTEDGLIDNLKIFSGELSYLVNNNGILKVAGDLYQYNEDNYKIITDGDSDKIALLNSTSKSNSKQNIIVQEISIQGGQVSNSNKVTSFSKSDTFKNNTLTIGVATHKINATVDLYYTSTPIYGDCPPDPDCMDPYSMKIIDECSSYCDRPIVGYNRNQYYIVKGTYKQRNLLFGIPIWVSWNPYKVGFWVSGDINFGKCGEIGSSSRSYTVFANNYIQNISNVNNRFYAIYKVPSLQTWDHIDCWIWGQIKTNHTDELCAGNIPIN